MTSESELRFEAVSRRPNLYEVVSERMYRAIQEAGLPPGAKLPSERVLGEQFGVSRTVIREAIRHLSAKGVLEPRPGAGVRVAGPSNNALSDSLALFLARQDVRANPEKIREVRECLEIATVSIAAERATDNDRAHIRHECERMAISLHDPEAASQADVAFHRAIAEATGNELFLVLVDSLGEVMLDIRRATLGSSQRAATTLKQHRAVADAIEMADREAAVDAMTEHLQDSYRTLARTLRRPTKE